MFTDDHLPCTSLLLFDQIETRLGLPPVNSVLFWFSLRSDEWSYVNTSRMWWTSGRTKSVISQQDLDSWTKLNLNSVRGLQPTSGLTSLLGTLSEIQLELGNQKKPNLKGPNETGKLFYINTEPGLGLKLVRGSLTLPDDTVPCCTGQKSYNREIEE